MQLASQQIIMCPAGEGWGKERGGKDCKQCVGKGFYLKADGKLFAFNMPPYVDFIRRRQGNIVKYILLLLFIGFLLLFILILTKLF